MNLTRGIALSALTLAIALAIGAISPLEPFARANPAPIYIIQTATPALPTPALAIVPLSAAAPTPEQPAAAPTPEQPTAAPALAVVEQPQVEQPQVEQPQVEQPQVEQLLPLETLHCPCNVLEAETPAPITDRDRAYSRARTR